METKIWQQVGLTDYEYGLITDLLGREPNNVELEVFGVMWSEHCSYKNSRPVLKNFPTKGPQVLQGPGENAGVVDIGDSLGIAFKIESHNHPSAVEPYQGSATAVGGIIRDIFTMGARPIALLDSLRFGSLSSAKSRYLFNGVVEGIGGYGNCIGIPTVGGETYFHPSYEDNPIVNAMCVGLVEHKDLAKGIATGVGNPVMVVGAKTGRDGIRGASFASEELGEDTEEKRPAVQVGDPFMEKLLLEACLELIKTGNVVGMQDMGAAGLTSSSCEMASKGDSGIEIDVALVPRREEGMTPDEVLISESQERMLVVPKKGKEDDVKRIFDKWGLDAVVVGRVTDDGIWRIKENDKVVAEIPAKALTEMCPMYNREGKEPDYIKDVQNCNLQDLNEPENYNKIFIDLLGRETIASKEWVYEQYDHMVGVNTIVRPGSDAAVVRIKGTKKAVALSTDCNSRYVYLNPYLGGKIAVSEAARNVVCSGAKPLGATNCLNFGNPEKPEVFWQFKESVNGMSEACAKLDTPITGGNVSLYNETKGESVFPTPVIGMVGLLKNVDKACTLGFKKEGDVILLLGENKDELGGSEFLAMFHGLEAGMPPSLDLDREKDLQNCTLQLIESGLVNSAHDTSEGGLSIALAECAMATNLGAEINIDSNIRPSALLFGETQSRIIISVNPKNVELIKDIANGFNLPVSTLGVVKGDSLKIKGNNFELDAKLNDMIEKYKGAIPCLMND
ncbi:phosphoribosylformylglycinamidine synthase subunit II [Desulfonispora thiosulfatigenes DSM 11270]|uniref:Phosphoribosylformylglycinamidine synthase subunit PurL n=1 Tax=Desulfonispora thiosulfatigenes DSM 11270 TaxID=656914 RepID=A0A1W1VE19_DESTI|nr:phosphoribosylformylglycinamidine synthase subunit PurL [Desulfonispora thiosulfatigenes]SMB91622.1 phosphoribosylformylglycinamidine synthase subunit II [Desulfonispora thiosulfatigenes DSM 11270]